jgi:GNAT superfamily N-acetyltransferase
MTLVTEILRLSSAQWQVARLVRLRALEESPDAFASSFDEEATRPESWWIAGTQKLAWFVAREDGDVVGVVAGIPASDCPEVISMWVHPAHRGTGVAGQLLAAVMQWAADEGAGELRLAVAEGNDRARRFYERAGFRPTGPGEIMRSRPEVCTTEMRCAVSSRRPGETRQGTR